jgi:hypothetical protein
VKDRQLQPAALAAEKPSSTSAPHTAWTTGTAAPARRSGEHIATAAAETTTRRSCAGRPLKPNRQGLSILLVRHHIGRSSLAGTWRRPLNSATDLIQNRPRRLRGFERLGKSEAPAQFVASCAVKIHWPQVHSNQLALRVALEALGKGSFNRCGWAGETRNRIVDPASDEIGTNVEVELA